MANRVVAFRVQGKDWESFRALADASGRSVQDVLREFISACVAVGSVDVKPVQGELDGSDLADELALRNDLRHLRGYIDHRNYERAKDFFGEVKLHLHGVRNPELLEEARSLSSVYLSWIDERERKTGSYEPEDED